MSTEPTDIPNHSTIDEEPSLILMLFCRLYRRIIHLRIHYPRSLHWPRHNVYHQAGHSRSRQDDEPGKNHVRDWDDQQEHQLGAEEPALKQYVADSLRTRIELRMLVSRSQWKKEGR